MRNSRFLGVINTKKPNNCYFCYTLVQMTSSELISQLILVTNDNRRYVEKKLSFLSANQLNWQKSTDSWSVKQTLIHLNEYARFYHTEFVKRIEQTRFKEPIPQFVSSPLGKSAWKSMKLGNANNVKRRFHSPKQYNPLVNNQLNEDDTVVNFLKNQLELVHILDSAKQVNLRKVKIPISISKIIRLRLGDALQFVIYHNERHIQQIKNTISQPEFPTKR
jgi:hypothetical protein